MNPEDLMLRIQVLEDRLNRVEKSDRFVYEKSLQYMDGRNVQLGRSVGSKFGTATDQKIGFLGATPQGRYNVTFPVTAADLYTALTAFGLTYHV